MGSAGDRVLLDFSARLGGIVTDGRHRAAPRDPGERDWAFDLSKEGHADLAALWESLAEAADGDDGAWAAAVFKLVETAGEKLHASVRATPAGDAAGAPPSAAAPPEPPADAGTRNPALLPHALVAGTLPRRRAAARALGTLIMRKRSAANRALVDAAVKSLDENRDPEIAFEVAAALSAFSGPEGRRAKAARERARRFMKRVHRDVAGYWDGSVEEEPVTAMDSDDLVMLGLWLRAASDFVAGHVEEILVDHLSKGSDRELTSLVSALIYCGDRRLLPAFTRILQDGRLQSRTEAAKAIAHVDDPRARAALEKALRHAADPVEKIVLARALARTGAAAHRALLLDAIAGGESEEIVEEALKAVAELESVDDRTAALLRDRAAAPSPGIARAALRALAHVGGAGDAELLDAVARENPKLRVAAKGAAQVLHARGLLAGRLPGEGEGAPESPPAAVADGAAARLPPGARLAALAWLLLALAALLVKMTRRSLEYARRSLARSPRSARARFLEGRILLRLGEHERSIETYRAAVELDPARTRRRPEDADRLIRAYIQRSIEVEEELGSPGEALALLEELGEMDLSRADPNLKIEIGRRRDALRFARLHAGGGGEEE